MRVLPFFIRTSEFVAVLTVHPKRFISKNRPSIFRQEWTVTSLAVLLGMILSSRKSGIFLVIKLNLLELFCSGMAFFTVRASVRGKLAGMWIGMARYAAPGGKAKRSVGYPGIRRGFVATDTLQGCLPARAYPLHSR